MFCIKCQIIGKFAQHWTKANLDTTLIGKMQRLDQSGEWMTKLLGWLRCRFRNQGSREKRFKGKSRSIFEAKFLRRHFFADFLSRLVAASQNHDDEDDGEDDDEDDGEDGGEDEDENDGDDGDDSTWQGGGIFSSHM